MVESVRFNRRPSFPLPLCSSLRISVIPASERKPVGRIGKMSISTTFWTLVPEAIKGNLGLEKAMPNWLLEHAHFYPQMPSTCPLTGACSFMGMLAAHIRIPLLRTDHLRSLELNMRIDRTYRLRI